MKIIATIFIALCLSHLQDASAEIKIHQKSHVDANSRLIFQLHSYKDGRLTHALCDKNPQADKIKCTVYREKVPFGDDSYTCNVTLNRPANHEIDLPLIEITPFGDNNVAIALMEFYSNISAHLYFTTVRMDSCEVGEAAIDNVPLSSYDFYVVGHRNSYDVFYRIKEISCGGKTCKVTIDANGKIVGGPKSLVEYLLGNYGIVRPIVALDDNSKTGEYFYVQDLRDDGAIFALVKRDGTEIPLARSSVSDISRPTTAISANNKLIGFCYPANGENKCRQHDFDGNLKMEMILPRDGDAKYILDIYNLPGGGCYVVFGGSTGNQFTQNVIQRIDSNGKKTGSFQFQGSGNYNWRAFTQYALFYENENKETCLSLITYEPRHSLAATEGKSQVRLTANCFTDADFNK